MNEKRKWITAGRLRRGAVILAAVGLTAGAALATAGSALAGEGSQPGNLQLLQGGTVIANGGTGSMTAVTTWQTTDGCPASFQGSGAVVFFQGTTNDGLISSTNDAVTAAFTGTFDAPGTIGAFLSSNGLTVGQTAELAVACYPAANLGGTPEYVQSVFVTETSSTVFTVSNTGPVTPTTTTTLASSASSVVSGGSVNLTATVTASDGSSPAGSVTFNNGATVLGTSAVTWSGATGTATLTGVTLTATSSTVDALTATFAPTSTTGPTGSTSAPVDVTVNPANQLTAGGTNPVVINVTVANSGTLTVTVAPGPVSLTVSGLVGTGTLPNVSILDTRNTFPGWSVSGQESTFTSSVTPSTPISGNQLGWMPAAVTGTGDGTFDGTHVVLGGLVSPASPGLGTTAQVLALAHAGFGSDPSGATTWVANAALTLDIPATTTAGAYTGDLTITYITAQA